MNCAMCHGEGRIPQRGAENSGAREVCPTCNGVGTVPENTQPSQVYIEPVAGSQPDGGVEVSQGNVDPIIPKADGADSSINSEVEAPDVAPTEVQADNTSSDGTDQSQVAP